MDAGGPMLSRVKCVNLSSIGPDGVRHCRCLWRRSARSQGVRAVPYRRCRQPQYAETGAHRLLGMLARAEQTVDIGADGKPRAAASVRSLSGVRLAIAWCAGGMCSLVVAWCALAATHLRRNGTTSYAVIPMHSSTTSGAAATRSLRSMNKPVAASST